MIKILVHRPTDIPAVAQINTAQLLIPKFKLKEIRSIIAFKRVKPHIADSNKGKRQRQTATETKRETLDTEHPVNRGHYIIALHGYFIKKKKSRSLVRYS